MLASCRILRPPRLCLCRFELPRADARDSDASGTPVEEHTTKHDHMRCQQEARAQICRWERRPPVLHHDPQQTPGTRQRLPHGPLPNACTQHSPQDAAVPRTARHEQERNLVKVPRVELVMQTSSHGHSNQV